MANSNFYEGYDGDAYTLDSGTTTTTLDSESSTVIEDTYEQEVRLTLNNWPLCAEDPECNNAEETPTELDPTLPQDGLGDCDITTRTYGVTFESIRQNIASYNYHTDLNDIKHLIRTYYLDGDKTITQEVDMRTPGVVYTKLSGDTGFEQTLVKTTIYTNNRIFDTVYGVE